MKNIIPLLPLLLSCCSTPAIAVQSTCPNAYANNERPDIAGQEICFDRFAVVYSPDTKTAVVSAERLTGGMVIGAEQIQRINAFHAERSVRGGPTPADYVNTGYDRGHMTPAGDMPTPATQRQTFSMVNMTPQTPELNRATWNRLEREVRSEAKTAGVLYVVTGALFDNPAPRTTTGIAIPFAVYKALYRPDRKQCAVHVATNTSQPVIQVLTVAQFEKRYGIHPFEEWLCD